MAGHVTRCVSVQAGQVTRVSISVHASCHVTKCLSVLVGHVTGCVSVHGGIVTWCLSV